MTIVVYMYVHVYINYEFLIFMENKKKAHKNINFTRMPIIMIMVIDLAGLIILLT